MFEKPTTVSSGSLDESLQLPGLSTSSDPSYESEDDHCSGQFTLEDARGCYDDWLHTLQIEDVQMMAMMVYDNYINRFGMLQTKATEEVALLFNTNEKNISRWRADWVANNGFFSESTQGKCKRYSVVDDEEYRDLALKWIRENASKKGKPNLMAVAFFSWLNNELLPLGRQHHPSSQSVPKSTRWLHKLGFRPRKESILMVMRGLMLLLTVRCTSVS